MLSEFNRIVFNSAVIILIISLIVIAFMINNSIRGANVQYPPVVGSCPDYWDAQTESSNNIYCINTLDIGNVGSTSMCGAFYTDTYPTNCDKLTVAKSCGMSWDGITNSQLIKEQCDSN
jgi:hypothetical protein